MESSSWEPRWYGDHPSPGIRIILATNPRKEEKRVPKSPRFGLGYNGNSRVKVSGKGSKRLAMNWTIEEKKTSLSFNSALN